MGAKKECIEACSRWPAFFPESKPDDNVELQSLGYCIVITEICPGTTTSSSSSCSTVAPIHHPPFNWSSELELDEGLVGRIVRLAAGDSP